MVKSSITIVVHHNRVKRIEVIYHLIASNGIRSFIERITLQERKRTILLMKMMRKVIFQESI